jgi:L-rhamnose mutarotase
MKDWLYTCDLKDDPEIIRQYDDFHANIWPEVAESLKSVGMREIKIWRLGTRMVMCITTDDDFDPAAASAAHQASHPRCAEWEELMKSFQRRPAEAGHGTSTWTEMTQVFTLTDHV